MPVQVEAAAAGECLEALEALLPDTATGLMALVAAHASAGARAAFATRQLLAIAARWAPQPVVILLYNPGQ